MTVPITLTADSGIKPGSYNVSVNARAGTQLVSQNFSIHVAQAFVVMQHESYYPANITVAQGTTIVWMNIDTPIGCCDPGFHTVTFISPNGTIIQDMSSPILHRFDLWSFEFSGAGVYHYYCTIHPSMQGIVNVTE